MSALIFLTVFLTSFLLIAFPLEGVLKKGYCERLLSKSAAYSSALPAKLSNTVLPGSRIFRSVSLPIPGRDGEEIQLGTVIVCRSGIFILCQINGNGIIENPPGGNWKHIYGGKCREYENPFKMQADARTLIDYYNECEGLTDVKAHSIIIYTDPTLKFTNPRPRGVIPASEFPKRLAYLERHGKLSRTDVKNACRILRDADSY